MIIINQDYIEALKQAWVKAEYEFQLSEIKSDAEFKNKHHLLNEIKKIPELENYLLLLKKYQQQYKIKLCQQWYQEKLRPFEKLQKLMELFEITKFESNSITEDVITGKYYFNEDKKIYLSGLFDVDHTIFDEHNFVRDWYGDSDGYYWYNPISIINQHLTDETLEKIKSEVPNFEDKMKNLQKFTTNDFISMEYHFGLNRGELNLIIVE